MPEARANAVGETTLIHVVPGIDEEASGPSYSVVRLCESLLAARERVQLAVLDASPATPRPRSALVQAFPVRAGLRRLGASPEMHRWLRAQVQSGASRLIHSHGLWEMPNVYPGWVTRRQQAQLVVSPRGTLARWALNHSKWVKRAFWPLVQGPAISHAACFHATAESEYEDIRRLGLRQPVAIIPNGVDLPASRALVDGERRTLLFLGRVHPKKGVDILLHAWHALAQRHPQWDLRIVGPDNGGYLAQMQRLVADRAIARVSFSGPVYGAAKTRAYQQAELFVLPTHSENFGMTVAEALAAGVPAIVTKGAPWQALDARGAGWWIDIGVDPLIACLQQALSCTREALAQRGASGRRWMDEAYSWTSVGAAMRDTYQWLRDGGTPPPWVKLN